jgi:fumarate hydratase class I
MRKIAQEDLVTSIEDALQFISYTHPIDYVKALRRAYELEVNPAAKSAMLQLLVNSRMSVLGHRPICQDTGTAQIFIKLGVEVQFYRRDGKSLQSLQALINEATRNAYTNPENPLRATTIADPLGARSNTKDNTPGQLFCEMTEGNLLEILVVAKGGGGDVKARFATLNPSDSVADWVIDQLPGMGAGWCPPGVLGVGIGASPEQATLLAKQSLFTPIDIDLLRAKGAQNAEEQLRLELFDRINGLQIGAQGLGGLATVLDVKVSALPCHAATIPVAIVPNCAATRYVRFNLDGLGPTKFERPPISTWDGIPDEFHLEAATKVNVDALDKKDIQEWKVGQTLLLSGKILTARDAAHKRLVDLLGQGKDLPVSLKGRFIYYVGPVDAIKGEAVGPAGPTTATRMDKFVEILLSQTGLLGMIGKAERGPDAIAAIKQHQSIYLAAVGGAAYMLSKAITYSEVIAFEDLGMEAIHEFELKDFPVIVAVDPSGKTIHKAFALEPLK